jgi:hypothetical protein
MWTVAPGLGLCCERSPVGGGSPHFSRGFLSLAEQVYSSAFHFVIRCHFYMFTDMSVKKGSNYLRVQLVAELIVSYLFF